MTEYRFQLNVKVGNDLVNIAAMDAEEFEAALKWVEENAAKVAAAALALAAVGQVAPLAAQTASTQVQSAPAPQPEGPVPTCRHGNMEFKPAGVGKASHKPFNAFWACTASRDQQCKPIWT